MAYGTVNADVIQTSTTGGSLGAGNASLMKNRIINGAMVIDQRNAGALVNPAVNGDYYLDRWRGISSAASKFSIGQNAGAVTPPVGFTNYIGITSLSAYSISATDQFGIRQSIEGLNVADLGWGTANAQTVTLSFWVRSSLTGTFGGVVTNSAQNRSYPFTYTISSANTWTQASVTIAGDTTGTWLTTNGTGILLQFSIGVGSTYSGTAGAWAAGNYFSATGATSVVGTNGATFYITGVQLEVGSSATGFEYRQYQQELALCQRYAYKISADATAVYARYGAGFCTATTNIDAYVPLKVSMRTSPSVTTTGTAANYAVYSGSGTVTVCSAVPTINTGGTTSENANIQVSTASGLTAGQGGMIMSNNTASSYLLFTAEL